MIKSIIKAARMYLGNLSDKEITQLSKDLSLDNEYHQKPANLLSKVAEEYEDEKNTHQDESFEDED